MLGSTAIQKFELASFLRWYVAVELHDPAYAKRFYSIYEILEDCMTKVNLTAYPPSLSSNRLYEIPESRTICVYVLPFMNTATDVC